MINESNIGSDSNYKETFEKTHKNEVAKYLWKFYESHKSMYEQPDEAREKNST